LGLKMNYLKRQGKAAMQLDWHNGKNGSLRWASAGRGDMMKKKNRIVAENLDQKSKGNIEKGL
jgi:hypothetical protein